MTGRTWWQTASAVLVGVCLALIVRFVFVKSLSILMLFGLGLLVAYLLDPVLDKLEKRRWPRWAAVWALTVAILMLIAVAGVLIVPGIVSQVQDAANNWRQYSDTAQATYAQWRAGIAGYAAHNLPDVDVMPFLDAKVEQASAWLANNIPGVLQWVSQQLIASVGLVALGGLLLLISFHFMMVIDPLRKSIHVMLPRQTDCEVDEIGTQINAMLVQYLRGVIVVSILVGIAATLLLIVHSWFFGTKYALIIGVVTGITYMIPYLGPLISAVGAGFFGYVTASQGAPWLSSLTALGAMYAVNQVFDMGVTPRVVGQRVGLHPLVVLFSVMMGYALLGVPGMIISTPAAASIKILMARWLPIKGMDFTAPCARRRLEIDLPASVGLLGRNLVKLGRGIEGSLRPQPSQEPQEPSQQTPEAKDGEQQ